MYTLGWEDLLRTHPAFEMLDDAERRTILDERVATERIYNEGELILHQGDLGHSIFLIGEGTADVRLEKPDDKHVIIYSIGRGELFGEMALIEDRPRAATLVAAEKTIVLEIKGEAFLELMKSNAEIGMVLLQRMSRRLRLTDSKITEKRLYQHDEALAILSHKIEAAIDTADAKLLASKTMYDQTTRRANEIIDSADRARNTMKWSISTAAAVLALLGGFGLWDIKQMRSNVQDDRRLVQADRDAIDDLRAELEEKKADIENQQALLRAAQAEMEEQMTALRASAQRVRTFTENAEADQRAAVVLEDLRNMRFSDEMKDGLIAALEKFDARTVNQLSITFISLLRTRKAFHAQLAPLLEGERLRNPNGRLFLTYHLALSALSEGASTPAYQTHKSKLENAVLLSTTNLTRPSYVSSNSGRILKVSLSRTATGEAEKAARTTEVEELMTLIGLVKEP